MNEFVNFIRFFLLSDAGLDFPLNGNLPHHRHATLPVVAGDTLRFLVAQADLGGHQPETLRLRLLNVRTNELGPQAVGLLRRQDAEAYSELRIRVNSGVADGDYRQFALIADVLNPAYQSENLALGQLDEGEIMGSGLVLSSSSLEDELSGTGLSTLTDGLAEYGGPYYSSAGDVLNPHDEFIILPLPEESTLTALTLWPRYLNAAQSLHFPVDLVAEVSSDSQNWTFVRQWVNMPAPVDGKAVSLDLPQNVTGTYLRLRFYNLRINPLDSTYRVQLSELIVTGQRKRIPPTLPANLLGTFRGQYADVRSYIQALRAFLEAYPYTPVTVDQDGSELSIRIYHSGRFDLGNVPVRVGIGLVRETNENQPLLSLRRGDTVVLPARTRYRIVVGNDIEQGNVFTLGGQVYTATGAETPEVILAKLGVTGGTIEVDSGTAPGVLAQVGSYNQANANKPTITLLYDHTTGSTDYYQAVIGPGVQPGNSFQVSCEGLTSRQITAGEMDTAASIAAFFNNESGDVFGVGIGKIPVGSALSGTQVLANTNSPTLSLLGRQEIAAQTLDEWSVYLSSSIQPGNTYWLGVAGRPETVIVAELTDTVLSLSARFGYDTHPFTIRVPTGAVVTGRAEAGPRYREPEHLAEVEVLESPVRYINLPWVAEVYLPDSLRAGHLYSLVLTKLGSDTHIAQSNYLRAQAGSRGTRLVRFADRGRVYGFQYQEAGLVQQLRLPIDLSAAIPQQEQALGKSLDGRTIRGLTRLETARTLTTTMLPETFHRALWAALKHRSLWIEGTAYESRGGYTQTEPTRRHRLMQAQIELVEADSVLSNGAYYKALNTDSQSAGYVSIRSIVVAEGLPVYLQSGTIVTQIRPGMSILPGVYKLLIRPGREALEVVMLTNGVRSLRSLLTPIVLNRVDQDLILLAGSEVDILTRPAPENHPVMRGFQEHSAESAFSVEYGSTYFQ